MALEEVRKLKRYKVENVSIGTSRYFYITDCETLEIVLIPSKYLKHKIKSNLSPNTVKRYAFSLCCYLEYLREKELEYAQVCDMGYEDQSNHFTRFLYWLKEGRHTEKNQIWDTDNGTCNAYLKDVFRFYLFLADCGLVKNLRVLSYSQMAVIDAVGVKRALRSNSFKGYMKAEERNVRIAKKEEIIATLQACTNTRDQLLILLISETGFRIGEILGVNYSRDIDYQNHTIGVYFREDNANKARAKNAEYRKAKISHDAFDFLLHYLAEYRELLQHSNYLFINLSGATSGQPLKVDSVYAMLDRAAKKTGIELTPHMLRRYFAVTRWKASWPLELISQALGHKHLDTTVQYLGILDDKLMEASREFYERNSIKYGIGRTESREE
ncbi:MAG: tyrosine-type recombinase/integrase [Enterocloster bolteae]|uniref:tyrosine-type recombinase/integrase n=1 Tax=Enterocloster bolteae TaxID=208479 RepID=UPI0039938AFA